MAPIPLTLIRSANSKLFTSRSDTLVAVFVGATTGIGSYALITLARTHGTTGSGLTVYLIGRNAIAAEIVFDECRKVCPAGQFVFVPCKDVALLKEVDIAAAKVIALENEEAAKKSTTPKIDVLVMCQGTTYVNGRKDTSEGLDTLMSLFYYSRMRLATLLLPLLLTSSTPTGARIISVLGPGNNARKGRERESSTHPTDLSLRNPDHYGFIAAGNQIAYMKTFFFEDLARKYEGKLSLIHYFPGLVWTDAFKNEELPAWMKIVIKAMLPLMNFFGLVVGAEETGERLLLLLGERFPAKQAGSASSCGGKGEIGIAMASDGTRGGGAYRAMFTGEEIPTVPEYERHRKEGLPELCVQHTLKAFEEIEGGRVFKD